MAIRDSLGLTDYKQLTPKTVAAVVAAAAIAAAVVSLLGASRPIRLLIAFVVVAAGLGLAWYQAHRNEGTSGR